VSNGPGKGLEFDLGRAWRGDTSMIPRPAYGWWEQAACTPPAYAGQSLDRWRKDVETFRAKWFPLGVNGPQTGAKLAAQYADAKGVCDACPVAADCLRASLIEEGGAATAVRFGMRGGMRPDERHAEWERLSDAHYRIRRSREAS